MDNQPNQLKKKEFQELRKECVQIKSKLESLSDLFLYCFKQLRVKRDKGLEELNEEMKVVIIIHSKEINSSYNYFHENKDIFQFQKGSVC